ncbi:hypothetical protein chiPu_0031304 [Chiloscyllium punctatum]|uniref:Uncharacterized protein n=1 Tax=Chiloscyllium punctatum TaxID=137246 RepID=A0A401TWI0_CHIPU|nr:hypothetical protein [Chiloscyllium punctatum]
MGGSGGLPVGSWLGKEHLSLPDGRVWRTPTPPAHLGGPGGLLSNPEPTGSSRPAHLGGPGGLISACREGGHNTAARGPAGPPRGAWLEDRPPTTIPPGEWSRRRTREEGRQCGCAVLPEGRDRRSRSVPVVQRGGGGGWREDGGDEREAAAGGGSCPGDGGGDGVSGGR